MIFFEPGRQAWLNRHAGAVAGRNPGAFIRRGPAGPPQVAVVNLDGTNLRMITRLPGTCGRPAWSPDGNILAFVSFVDDRPQLFTVSATGEGADAPRPLTQENGAVYAFCWISEH